MAAFYDDSGIFSPGQGNYVCLGMIVISFRVLRECGNSWWKMLSQHFPNLISPENLPLLGIEAKSGDVCDMLRKCHEGSSLKTGLSKTQSVLYQNGLDTQSKITELINDVYGFLEHPPTQVKYLASVANKNEVWQKFYPEKIARWNYQGANKQVGHKKLGQELGLFLQQSVFEFLLQRLEYISKEKDFEYSDSFVIGDETTQLKSLLKRQSEVQAGLGSSFSQLTSVVNKSWFGSSLYDPCLQMADWIAFTVRIWAEGNTSNLDQLLPNFRGYPDQVLGRGIVPCPDKDCFPVLPSHEVV